MHSTVLWSPEQCLSSRELVCFAEVFCTCWAYRWNICFYFCTQFFWFPVKFVKWLSSPGKCEVTSVNADGCVQPSEEPLPLIVWGVVQWRNSRVCSVCSVCSANGPSAVRPKICQTFFFLDENPKSVENCFRVGTFLATTERACTQISYEFSRHDIWNSLSLLSASDGEFVRSSRITSKVWHWYFISCP